MNVTLVKRGNTLIKIYLGKPTEKFKDWLSELNTNPLTDEKYSFNDEYQTEKTLEQIKDFLDLN